VTAPAGREREERRITSALRIRAVSLALIWAKWCCYTCGWVATLSIVGGVIATKNKVYANDPSGKEYSFVVTRAVRLGTRRADDEKYDPFLLVLREIETGKEQVLPTFWAYGQNNTQRGGQFPPLLTFEEWKTLSSRLDASFRQIEERIRLRAYELYERRGRRDGHALDDWLQAEAELRGQKVLRAAA
jgi:hypothetical protein